MALMSFSDQARENDYRRSIVICDALVYHSYNLHNQEIWPLTAHTVSKKHVHEHTLPIPLHKADYLYCRGNQ